MIDNAPSVLGDADDNGDVPDEVYCFSVCVNTKCHVPSLPDPAFNDIKLALQAPTIASSDTVHTPQTSIHSELC